MFSFSKTGNIPSLVVFLVDFSIGKYTIASHKSSIKMDSLIMSHCEFSKQISLAQKKHLWLFLFLLNGKS